MNEPLPIFVYGTLKRGQGRDGMWPHAPVEVRQATVRAALYDVGPYPAIIAGEDLIAGELWLVRGEHMEDTLKALDKIECFGQGGVDLYVRRAVEARDADGQSHRTYAYFYAAEQALADCRRIRPEADGCCRWSGA